MDQSLGTIDRPGRASGLPRLAWLFVALAVVQAVAAIGSTVGAAALGPYSALVGVAVLAADAARAALPAAVLVGARLTSGRTPLFAAAAAISAAQLLHVVLHVVPGLYGGLAGAPEEAGIGVLIRLAAAGLGLGGAAGLAVGVQRAAGTAGQLTARTAALVALAAVAAVVVQVASAILAVARIPTMWAILDGPFLVVLVVQAATVGAWVWLAVAALLAAPTAPPGRVRRARRAISVGSALIVAGSLGQAVVWLAAALAPRPAAVRYLDNLAFAEAGLLVGALGWAALFVALALGPLAGTAGAARRAPAGDEASG